MFVVFDKLSRNCADLAMTLFRIIQQWLNELGPIHARQTPTDPVACREKLRRVAIGCQTLQLCRSNPLSHGSCGWRDDGFDNGGNH
jgi:hypothetical protein